GARGGGRGGERRASLPAGTARRAVQGAAARDLASRRSGAVRAVSTGTLGGGGSGVLRHRRGGGRGGAVPRSGARRRRRRAGGAGCARGAGAAGGGGEAVGRIPAVYGGLRYLMYFRSPFVSSK